jgi:hypothetical protein
MAGQITISTLKNDTGVLATQNGMTGIAKAWVNFNGTGTPAIRGSFNVSSITDNGTGDYTINFTTTMPNADYSLVGNCLLNNNTDTRGFISSPNIAGGYAPTTSAARFSSIAAGVGNQDFAFVCVTILGS